MVALGAQPTNLLPLVGGEKEYATRLIAVSNGPISTKGGVAVFSIHSLVGILIQGGPILFFRRSGRKLASKTVPFRKFCSLPGLSKQSRGGKSSGDGNSTRKVQRR